MSAAVQLSSSLARAPRLAQRVFFVSLGSRAARHAGRNGATQPAAAASCRRLQQCRLQRRRSIAVHAAAEAEPGANPGDYVECQYTIMTPDGAVFDTSRREGGRQAEFILGSANLVPGFHQAVGGLQVGESRQMLVRADDAYGERREEMMAIIPKEQAPEGLKPGTVMQLSNGMPAVVAAVDEEGITIDANHPLAGKDLTFDVELTKHIPGAQLQSAAFGAGCFWGPELAFQRVQGVVQTEVGYSQGTTKNPTYDDVCGGNTGHAEVVQVVYHPAEVSFEQLLDVFWERHDPTALNRQGGDVGTQYRSGIYWTTEEQRQVAEASLARQNEKLGGQVVTELEKLNNYWTAEEHHQRFLERGGRYGQGQSAAKSCNDPIRCYG